MTPRKPIYLHTGTPEDDGMVRFIIESRLLVSCVMAPDFPPLTLFGAVIWQDFYGMALANLLRSRDVPALEVEETDMATLLAGIKRIIQVKRGPKPPAAELGDDGDAPWLAGNEVVVDYIRGVPLGGGNTFGKTQPDPLRSGPGSPKLPGPAST